MVPHGPLAEPQLVVGLPDTTKTPLLVSTVCDVHASADGASADASGGALHPVPPLLVHAVVLTEGLQIWHALLAFAVPGEYGLPSM